MSVLVGVVVGFLAGRLAWLLMRPVFGGEVFARENYRHLRVPTAGGLVIALALIAVEAARALVAAALDDPVAPGGARLAVLVLTVGMALLGLVDDLAGEGADRGFRGHAAAVAQGRLTTGGLKVVGGAAVSLVAVAAAAPTRGFAYLLADAAVVALAANLGNLFDRAPGRTIKVSATCFAVLVAATAVAGEVTPVAIVIGAALALLLDDLHERVMLGDTGANVLGGVLGLAVVLVGSPVVRLATLAALAILNGLSEWMSFSRIIEAVPPLRLLDRAGRRR